MKESNRVRFRILLIVLVVFIALAAIIWVRQGQEAPESGPSLVHVTPELSSSISTPPVTPSPKSTPAESPAVPQVEPGFSSPTPGEAAPPTSFVGQLNLTIPVMGVRPEQLIDTFADARSEGRVHDAMDIAAAAGTPVVAVSDGEIVKLFQSERGGTTIYQLSPDKRLVFYYAHLQRYADGIQERKYVRQGDVIAYVGDTGNAGAGNYHLHFSIAAITDPARHWEGTSINPYPLLKKK